MTSDNIKRVRYFEGQLLTAKDFDDQQQYHIEKLNRFVNRFPTGIIRGLNVTCSRRNEDDPDDFDGFKIEAGFAIDENGRLLVVGSEGIKVNKARYTKDRPYLSIYYEEKAICAPHSVCDSPLKNNRVVESVKADWDDAPNKEKSRLTVALICEVGEVPEGFIAKKDSCFDAYKIIEKTKSDLRPIRLDAGLIGEEQLTNGAVTSEKLAEDVKGKLVTEELKDNIENHDHSPDSSGGLIRETGLSEAVKAKLVTDDLKNRIDTHDHSAGSGGGLIGEPGLSEAVKAKLVTDDLKNRIDTHDHSAGSGGGLIGEPGLSEAVKAKLVTDDLTNKIDTHDHSAGSGGGLIGEGALAVGAVTSSKLGIVRINSEGPFKGESTVLTVSVDQGDAYVMIQVIPTGNSKLSWISKIGAESNSNLVYEITIKNEKWLGENTTPIEDKTVGYKILEIDLGICLKDRISGSD